MLKTKLLAGVFAVVLAGVAAPFASAQTPPPPPPPPNADIAWVQRERTPYGSWEQMARFFLSQIRTYDVEGRFGEPGPAINSLIAINPDALEDARASDARRLAGQALPLDGVPWSSRTMSRRAACRPRRAPWPWPRTSRTATRRSRPGCARRGRC
ncbi:hypothetical protein [Brevundimonas aurantiaca]|uniref:hypothetical protein n=1 Tax=Brevundimonas aurantiaca TaxID=74316 RepID=UPI003521893B